MNSYFDKLLKKKTRYFNNWSKKTVRIIIKNQKYYCSIM